MKLAVLKETAKDEARVAATPESVKKLKALGLDVTVQTGAGAAARMADADYVAAGASIAPDARSARRASVYFSPVWSMRERIWRLDRRS